MTKIDKMYYLYGKGNGLCKECNRLTYIITGDRNTRRYKCQNYGVSNAESTDWRLNYQACGKKDQVCDKEGIKVYVPKAGKFIEIDGQIRIEEVIDA